MCYHVSQTAFDFREEFKVTVPKHWAKSAEQADDIANKTLNAKAETIF